MTVPAPEPAREAGEQAQPGGEVRFTWVPGSGGSGVEVSGPVPPGQVPDGPVVTGGPAGVDWQALGGRWLPRGAWATVKIRRRCMLRIWRPGIRGG